MSPRSPKDIGALLKDRTVIDSAMRDAFHAAIRRHRQGNVPMAMWEDGRTVLVSPFDVPLPEDEQDRSAAD